MSGAGIKHRTDHVRQDKDTGCEFAPSCLNCPFSNCIESKLRRGRLHQIRKLIDQGIPQEEVAARMGMTIAGVTWLKASHHTNYQAGTP